MNAGHRITHPSVGFVQSHKAVLCSWHFCDINSNLIEGLHLLLASVTSVFIIAAVQTEGQGVKHSSRPAALAVVTSTGLQNPECKLCRGNEPLWPADFFTRRQSKRSQGKKKKKRAKKSFPFFEASNHSHRGSRVRPRLCWKSKNWANGK